MNLLQTFYKDKFSGLLAALIVAIAAVFLSEHYGAPTMLFALLLGVALNFLSEHEKCSQGIDMAAKQVLRFGVALLGLRISFDAISQLGGGPVILVVVGVFATMLLGFILTRTMKTNCAFGCLTGGAVAICGASAAMALSSVLPAGEDRERDTIFTVITVTAFSTIAMVVYPIIASFVGLDDQQTGIFLGATIHDVAQVVGAGYGVSDQTGDVATIVKLLRVAMLLPVVLGVMMIVRYGFKDDTQKNAKLPFPWFVLGFVALVGLNSTVEIPSQISSSLIDVSSWCIVTAVAALGMKTSFGALVKVGWMPVAVVLIETVFLAALCLAAIFIFEL
ncbi:conserved membrane hypothetical protein [Candidatus Terasakiella magnetica]|uniref:Sulfate exporter family transporter n=1 Tax=Candidatus Terasakiella magnetica TaxID=1867952 RepID=A0A1C3RM02_9PROT|nr:YeiH family protein [Candidatus Terasakiella magnetica]SCA58314.1 conserved membrane hypothetical protein [Candidatus Terasakiella magnetica]